MGVAEGNLEMLFIHNDYRGKGIGKKLIRMGWTV
jgi:putative acetyltransferase